MVARKCGIQDAALKSSGKSEKSGAKTRLSCLSRLSHIYFADMY